MLSITDGQCGKCAHFGNGSHDEPRLVQIRVSGQAEPDIVEPCGHPKNADLDLKVTPISGCEGYMPAKVA